MTANPYRTQTAEPGERLRCFPGLAAPLVGLMLVLACAPALLHLFLWSRVVEVRCRKSAGDLVLCEVASTSLASDAADAVILARPWRAQLRGATDRSRGDVWIEVETATRTVPLTSGFNLAKDEQRRLATDLTAFFGDSRERLEGRFGSRWSTVPVPALALGAALGLYFLFGLRLTLRRRADLGTVEIELRRWPLPGRHLGFELRDVRAVAIGGDPQARIHMHKSGPNISICLASGKKVRLAYVAPTRALRLQERVRRFVVGEREPRAESA